MNLSPLREVVISSEDIKPQLEKGIHPSVIERIHGDERSLVSLIKELGSVRLVVLVGDPGAGKSTQLRHMCIEPRLTVPELVPVFVAVRDLSVYAGDLVRAVGALLYRSTIEQSEARRIALALSQRGRLLLCLDGLDELDEANPAEARSRLRQIRVQIEELLAAHQNNRVVISVRRESFATCRPELPADYQAYEVMPLTNGHIRELIAKWFDSVNAEKGKALLRACEGAGWPAYISNPLLVVLTCIVFERRNRLPDRPSELYRRCLDVLLEEWDATRRLTRHESIANFSTERKMHLLAETALDFHTHRRCCYHRSEVIGIVERHLPKVGLDASTASAAVGEIASQHGLLRSWSIEGHLAFPHLCFQEYLAAKALRDRSDGHDLLAERVCDPFWHEVIRLYASLGDTAPLVEILLSVPDTTLRQRLLMAASCICRGAKVSRPELRGRVITALDELAKGPVLYLNKKAIDALAAIETPEANAVLRSHYRKEDGKLDFESYASRYAVKIDGTVAVDEMVSAFVTHEDTPREVLEALRVLPKDRLIPILVDFINNQTYPRETSNEQNFCVRHRRRDSAKLLAKIGELDALQHLQAALRNSCLTDYVREGIVRAMAMLPGDGATRLLQEVLDDTTLPTDCRVCAARLLGTTYPEAGAFLRQLVGDRKANHYDRRDAASALLKFTLSAADVPLFSTLVFEDRPDIFWGGPAYAAELLHQIDDTAAKAVLAEAEKQWRRSRNPDRELVLKRIVPKPKPAKPFQNPTELTQHLAQIKGFEYKEDRRQIVLEYYTHYKSDAEKLFELWLALPPDECGFVPSEASIVIDLLDRITLTPKIARSVLDLALRQPWNEHLWEALTPYDSILELEQN